MSDYLIVGPMQVIVEHGGVANTLSAGDTIALADDDPRRDIWLAAAFIEPAQPAEGESL